MRAELLVRRVFSWEIFLYLKLIYLDYHLYSSFHILAFSLSLASRFFLLFASSIFLIHIFMRTKPITTASIISKFFRLSPFCKKSVNTFSVLPITWSAFTVMTPLVVTVASGSMRKIEENKTYLTTSTAFSFQI